MKLEQIKKIRDQIIDAKKDVRLLVAVKPVDESLPQSIENARIAKLVEDLNKSELVD